jgi:RNA polymerase primary sigma factor
MNGKAYQSLGGNGSLERYLKDIAQIPLLTRDEELALAAKARKGHKPSQQKLVTSNLRLVVKIGLEYSGLGLPIPDLVSEGNIGLVRAAELYNPDLGTRFSTYAALWIKQRIRRAITNQSRAVRVPIWKNQMVRRMQQASDALTSELGRLPSEEELASDMGIEADAMAKLRKAQINVASLDAPIGGDADDDRSLFQTIMDENMADPAQEISKKDLLLEVVASMNILNDKELKILALRFGLDGEEEKTLDSIGQQFKVSRERVRQLQEIALTKLRRALTDQEKQGKPAGRRSRLRQVQNRLSEIIKPKKGKKPYSVPFLSTALA